MPELPAVFGKLVPISVERFDGIDQVPPGRSANAAASNTRNSIAKVRIRGHLAVESNRSPAISCLKEFNGGPMSSTS